MIGNMKETEIKEFTLGRGSLYVKRGRVREEDMEDYLNKAGDTDGECTLSYEYKTRELHGIDGGSAAILRYGEKVRIKGRLCRMHADALKCVTGGGRMTVLLVCPLPNGEDFRVCVNGSILSGISFNMSDGGGVQFEFLCGRGVKHPRLRLAGGAA